jgi:hypothetical protein
MQWGIAGRSVCILIADSSGTVNRRFPQNAPSNWNGAAVGTRTRLARTAETNEIHSALVRHACDGARGVSSRGRRSLDDCCSELRLTGFASFAGQTKKGSDAEASDPYMSRKQRIPGGAEDSSYFRGRFVWFELIQNCCTRRVCGEITKISKTGQDRL